MDKNKIIELKSNELELKLKNINEKDPLNNLEEEKNDEKKLSDNLIESSEKEKSKTPADLNEKGDFLNISKPISYIASLAPKEVTLLALV